MARDSDSVLPKDVFAKAMLEVSNDQCRGVYLPLHRYVAARCMKRKFNLPYGAEIEGITVSCFETVDNLLITRSAFQSKV